MTDVLVVAELMDGGVRKTTLSAIGAARTVTEATSGAFDVLVIGPGAKGAASQAAAFGARKLIVTELAGGYLAEAYAPTVAKLAANYGVVVATASTYGKDQGAFPVMVKSFFAKFFFCQFGHTFIKAAT